MANGCLGPCMTNTWTCRRPQQQESAFDLAKKTSSGAPLIPSSPSSRLMDRVVTLLAGVRAGGSGTGQKTDWGVA